MPRPIDPTRRALEAAILFWTLAAAIVLAVSLGAVGKAYPGFELGPTGMLGVTDMDDWAGRQAGLVPLDRIVAVDGQPLGPPDAFFARVRGEAPGTVHRYRLDTGRELAVPARAFTWWDYVRACGLFWLGGMAHLTLGAWVAWRRPGLPAAIAHWRFCQAFGLFLLTGTLAPFYPTWEIPGDLAAFAVGVFVLELALAFPRPLAAPAWLLAAQRGLAVALMALVIYSCVDQAWYRLTMQVILLWPCLQVLAAIGLWLWLAFARGAEQLVRAQARVIVLGMAVSMGPSLAFAFAGVFKVVLPGSEAAFLGFLAFPAAIAYAIVRHRVFELDRLLRGATLYSLLTAALGGLYLAAVAVGHLAWGGHPGATSFLAALAVAVGLRPLHDGLHRIVDRVFLGARPDPLATLAELEAGVTELGDLATRTAALVRTALRAGWVEVGLGEAIGRAGARPAGAPADVVLPIRPAEGPAGALEVGARDDELPYTGGERALLGVLALSVARGAERLALAEGRH
ncbi:MAG: Two component sensor histidine kinase, partial [Cyanobacteria bacterium RYN_339]|nr:Two component sensor histidine kinase [Cyanobacteria bacterium RYN_339]